MSREDDSTKPSPAGGYRVKLTERAAHVALILAAEGLLRRMGPPKPGGSRWALALALRDSYASLPMEELPADGRIPRPNFDVIRRWLDDETDPRETMLEMVRRTLRDLSTSIGGTVRVVEFQAEVETIVDGDRKRPGDVLTTIRVLTKVPRRG